MERIFFSLGALSALVAVAAGAFGAHVLQDRLSSEMLTTFQTAARYQIYHAVALLATAWAVTRWPGLAVTAAGWLFIVGTVLFSGSLYLLTFTGIRWLGTMAPLGGGAFIAGWLCLTWGAWRG
jgi:uncharacterized membrane protein YgdD (TMEM256/DUF423 family)